MVTRNELIEKYLKFFKSKKHKEIPNSSLIPENDPTALFISAGMHPLVPYLLGQPHPQGKRLVNIQKCIRTTDIEEVGDEYHHTFFEMVGNWSLNDYWKKQAIEYSIEFLTKVLKISKNKISITCFKGNKDAKKDTESANIWDSLGIKKIKFLGKKDNWWGPTGKTGPCGPDTEMFVNNVEIWNDVFMEYNKDSKGNYIPAKQKNIDTGMGVERTLAILNDFEDNYLTEIWKPLINQIEKLSKKTYGKDKEITKFMRIIADHIKASVFILAENILPSNTEQGYVLRRLIRRATRYGNKLKIKNFTKQIAEPVFSIYSDYTELKNKNKILQELEKEEEKFLRTLEKGLNRFSKLTKNKKNLSGKDSFLLYQSFGFPIEMIEEECKKNKIKFSKKEFEKEVSRHQIISRTATEGRFKSGLADDSEKTTRLHTATHLLITALRKVLKNKNIIQRGSNITAERLRLDFSFPRKITQEELKKIEDLVNNQIKKSCNIIKKEMSPQEAKKQGALGIFDKKYKDKVYVYCIEDFSKEICAGPHVKNTCELGKFKILKEQSSSEGVRRIKAVLT
ncbi:MAG: alanine--tRNA ligase [Nanoarchaeota archaeon]|nr:alanine--tRNA ligase [Nanoarchaeota archaeon]MBU1027674.1 alanine--tRNA ligase [Nanoarchaeota archaeon]